MNLKSTSESSLDQLRSWQIIVSYTDTIRIDGKTPLICPLVLTFITLMSQAKTIMLHN